MRKVYSERLSVLLESAREHLGDLMEISRIKAGLQTVGWLPSGVSARQVAGAAKKHGVELIPLSHYTLGATAT